MWRISFLVLSVLVLMYVMYRVILLLKYNKNNDTLIEDFLNNRKRKISKRGKTKRYSLNYKKIKSVKRRNENT